MRTIEEMRLRTLEVLQAMARRPMMYAEQDCCVEHIWHKALTDLAFIDERHVEVSKAINDAFERVRVTNQGIRGVIRERFPGLPNASSEIISIYAEIAYDFGYLKVNRLLSAPEWASLVERLQSNYFRRDSTSSQVIEVFGPPTLVIAAGLCYGPESRESRWVIFDFCDCAYRGKGVSWAVKHDVDSLLRDVRIPASTLQEEIRLTPHGETCPDVVAKRRRRR